MNKCRNVLVFPAGTEIGLEIFNAMKECKEVRLFAAGQNVSNHAQYMYPEYHILPSIHEADCLGKLEELVIRLGIEYIFPAYDDIIVELSKAQHLISAKVIAPSLRISELTRSKLKTYEFLRDTIPVPVIYKDKSEVDSYPVIVKPDKGQGSFGVVKVENERQLAIALENTKDPLICEYLPGEEYTVDCFSDRDLGVLFAGPRLRRRVRNGISVNTETTMLDEADSYAKLIGARLGLHGAWFFQLKRAATGELKLLEVAPRIAGSMASHRVSGVNFPLLSIFEEERLPLSIQLNKGKIVLDRALKNRYRHSIKFKTLYVDLDDTLILNDKVNIEVVKLIYKSVNENKRIVLITRHKLTIEETLRKHKLSGLFDEVIQLSIGEKKSSYIRDKESIFVDDSYSERRDVFDRHGIATFDTSMIEVLTEGRYDESI